LSGPVAHGHTPLGSPFGPARHRRVAIATENSGLLSEAAIALAVRRTEESGPSGGREAERQGCFGAGSSRAWRAELWVWLLGHRLSFRGLHRPTCCVDSAISRSPELARRPDRDFTSWHVSEFTGFIGKVSRRAIGLQETRQELAHPENPLCTQYRV